MYKKDKITYRHINNNYEPFFVTNEYELKFVNNEIVSIRNGFGFEIDKKSHVWYYFTNKYGNG